ncbi:3-oxoacid CoA-transferase subunit B [Paramaledivibacter caminithermalis]|jgi:acetate CoA/acetoacetate CoA-transferase beta subunit|uniref:Butyryl-CoA:acetoacetate CoA-transferase beta subunit n=1 Tax=Paramaledivibacter caminithermalis (strain DSM 15212 / CIP 107654 / DViRD3) TaxID=1121301 RepID=A0A1M6Q2S2_PARC5|nr:3-oxoacid CoA-transferase subunit B [Paramaledivibacter caminithermalis]SHK14529.1 butyryl-CoA:acetoacetate CoA-transferase beta subunit [Paramaledivibacter caminithermalis DSM 15212]
MNSKEFIARRIAKELKDGDIVNLGIGLPTMVANYVPENINVTFQSENGFLGLGPAPEEGKEDKDLTNAGAQPVTMLNGGCFFDSSMSFSIIRGGHVDITVLGALQVDGKGNLANWMVPNKIIPGMGGAMDLVTGAKKVIIGTEHCTKKGAPKILKECIYPLTGANVVDVIVTELAYMTITDKGLVLEEIAPNVTVEEVISKTDAELIIAHNLKIMDIE